MKITNSNIDNNKYNLQAFRGNASYQPSYYSAQLPKGQETIIPNNSQLVLGNLYTLNLRNPKLKNLLDKKKEVIIGSNSKANIPVNSFYSDVEDEHLMLEKRDNSIYAKNLSESSTAKYIPSCKITPFLTGCEYIQMSQGNIGDCYLLASIYALSCSKKGQNILKQMVKIEDDGSYIVTFKDKKPICVKADELSGETYKNGTVKKCVSGDLSLRAIERAYAKMIKTRSNNANMQQLNKGGFPQDAVKIMTGIEPMVLQTNLYTDYVLKEVEKNGTENYILMCSTPIKKNQGKYADKNKKFLTAHAYAIKSIDVEKQTIEIINPHDTRKSEIVSMDTFKNIFDLLYVARI